MDLRALQMFLMHVLLPATVQLALRKPATKGLVICSRNRAKRRSTTQSVPVSMVNFVKVSFKVLFILSICPEL